MRNKLLALAVLALTASLVRAQDQSAGSETSRGAQPEPYQVSVILKITDHGKLTIDQTFTLAAASEGAQGANPSVRDGDRIPIPTDKSGTQWQYIETGTNIDVEHLHKIGTLIAMQLRIENSGALAQPTSQGVPILRTLHYSLTPVVPLGKSVLIYSSGDGINSQKVDIQLQVQTLTVR